MTTANCIANTLFRGKISLWITVFILFFASCEEKNPEMLQYEAMKSSLKFKSYKTLSENTIPALILLYNSTSNAEDPDISEGELRLLLAYSWIANGKADYCIAESIIIRDISGSDNNQKNLSWALETVALSRKGLKELASDASYKCSPLLAKSPQDNKNILKNMVFHVIMAELSINEKNYQACRYHFAAFGIVSEIIWPYHIADAMADISEGKINDGIKKIKEIVKNKKIPLAVKKSLSESISDPEKISIKENAHQIWTSFISKALNDDLKNSSVIGIDKASELLGILGKKLNIE